MAPSVSLPLGCKSVVRPLVEDLFINHANGPGRLSRPLHECHLLDCSNIFGSGPSFFASECTKQACSQLNFSVARILAPPPPKEEEPEEEEDEEEEEAVDEVDSSKANNIANNVTTQAAPPATKPRPKRSMAIWIQVGIIVIVAIILFLVIQNMEPATKSKIGKLDGH